MPDLEAPYFREIFAGLKDLLGKSFRLVVNDEETTLAGAVFLAPGRGDVRLARVGKRVPCVVINGSSAKFPWVDLDNKESSRLAAAHLIEHHHQRIGIINGKMEMTNARDRYLGCRKAMMEHHIPLEPKWVLEGRFDRETGRRAMAAFLAMRPRPTAVFAANDGMALGALDACHRAGFSVPDDMAVVGFDDIPEAKKADPPLTTVRQPLREMAHAGARFLLESLAGSARERRKIFAGELVTRHSCGCGR